MAAYPGLVPCLCFSFLCLYVSNFHEEEDSVQNRSALWGAVVEAEAASWPTEAYLRYQAPPPRVQPLGLGVGFPAASTGRLKKGNPPKEVVDSRFSEGPLQLADIYLN